MTLMIVLFAAGVIMLALEVVLPGGVLGIAGGVALLIGVTVAFDAYGFDGGMIAIAGALVCVTVALYLEFVLLPRSRLAKAFSMTSTMAGRSQPQLADRSVIGKQAVAVTPLVPSGIVECEGRRFEAFARSGHVNSGESLDIVDLDNFRLIVSKTSTNQLK